MRIRNIINSLISRWVIFSLVTWSILFLLASFLLVHYLEIGSLKEQKMQLQGNISVLTEKKEKIERESLGLKLEDRKLSEILSDLLSASKKSRVRLGETRVTDVIEHENYQSLPITILIKGNYNQIGHFVNLIEKSFHFRVLELNLSTQESKGTGILCRINVEFINI